MARKLGDVRLRFSVSASSSAAVLPDVVTALPGPLALLGPGPLADAGRDPPGGLLLNATVPQSCEVQHKSHSAQGTSNIAENGKQSAPARSSLREKAWRVEPKGTCGLRRFRYIPGIYLYRTVPRSVYYIIGLSKCGELAWGLRLCQPTEGYANGRYPVWFGLV